MLHKLLGVHAKWSRRPGSIYDMSDDSIYLSGRGRKERGPKQRGIIFAPQTVRSPVLEQTLQKKKGLKLVPTSPSLCHVINLPRPSCSILAHCKVYHSIPQYTTVYHSIPQYTTVYYSTSHVINAPRPSCLVLAHCIAIKI